jgi:hypothetical protein
MRLTVAIAFVTAAIALSGCVAYDVASTAVSVTTTVVGTTVDVASGAVSAVTDGSGDAKK